jgi:hypothetical protein
MEAVGIGPASTIDAVFILTAGGLTFVVKRYGVELQRWRESFRQRNDDDGGSSQEVSVELYGTGAQHDWIWECSYCSSSRSKSWEEEIKKLNAASGC